MLDSFKLFSQIYAALASFYNVTKNCKPYPFLSHDVTSESDITPCIKIDKPLVVYRFTGKLT